MNPYSSYRAACKQWSIGLAVLLLVVAALTGLPPVKLLWAAGPLLMLGLVEAGYAARERSPEAASASVGRTTRAALSLSIWPFYLGLFALVALGGQQMAASNKKASHGIASSVEPASVERTMPTNNNSAGMMAQRPQPRQFSQMSPQQAQMLLHQAQAQQVPAAQRLPNGAIVAARPPAFPGVVTPLPVPPSAARPLPSVPTPGANVVP